jgi:hypothetical protein
MKEGGHGLPNAAEAARKVWRRKPHALHTLGVGVGKRTHQHGIGDGEHCGGRADANAECEEHDSREAGTSPGTAKCVLNVYGEFTHQCAQVCSVWLGVHGYCCSTERD